MPWTAVLAILALLSVQVAFVGACLYAYSRIRTQQDQAGQQYGTWGARLELAVSTADTARKAVEQIELEHFRKLRARFEEQESELARMRVALKICETKLASEERMGRRDDARRRKEEEAEVPPAPPANAGVPAAPGGDVDSLLRQFGVPLNGAPPAAPAAPAGGFGRVAKSRGG